MLVESNINVGLIANFFGSGAKTANGLVAVAINKRGPGRPLKARTTSGKDETAPQYVVDRTEPEEDPSIPTEDVLELELNHKRMKRTGQQRRNAKKPIPLPPIECI